MDPTQPPEKNRAISDLRAAFGFLTRLPVRASGSGLARACWAFPVTGLAVGPLAGAFYALALFLYVPPLAAALLALLAGAMLTGGLHEDGLADTADGLGGGEPARRLEIMRDSRIGTYGMLALIFSVGLRAAALGDIAAAGPGFAAIVAAATVSRGLLPAMMHALPLASRTGLAASVGHPGLPVAALALAIALVGAMILLGPALGLGGFIIATIFVATVALLAWRSIGGYNGDTLGAAQQGAEIAVLITVAANF